MPLTAFDAPAIPFDDVATPFDGGAGPTPAVKSTAPTLTVAGWSNLFVPRPLGQLPRFSAPRHEFFGKVSCKASVESAFSARSPVPRQIVVDVPPSPLYHVFKRTVVCRVSVEMTHGYRDRLREIMEQDERDLLAGVL
jgi:hypothetical protein